MSTYCAAQTLPSIIFDNDNGVSNESRSIEKIETELLKHDSRSISLGWRSSLINQLTQLSEKYSSQGWDGYEALPISKQSLVSAGQFILSLPDSIETPDIIPEPDGEIALEWRSYPNVVFSVSTSGGHFAYAGLLGKGRECYGTERISNEIPETITHILTNTFFKK